MRSLLIVLLLATSADACHRCGNYKACSYVAVQPVVQPAATYIINTTTTQPLVAGGSTAYVSNPLSLQQQMIPLLDPNQYFSQEMQLMKAADGVNALRHERTASLFKQTLELQAGTAERLAAGQAAAMALQAAGGSTTTVTKTTQSIITNSNDVLQQFCGKCHGGDNSSPSKGIYLWDEGESAKWMKEHFFTIQKKIRLGEMPPSGSPQPTQDQKVQILNRIESIIDERVK